MAQHTLPSRLSAPAAAILAAEAALAGSPLKPRSAAAGRNTRHKAVQVSTVQTMSQSSVIQFHTAQDSQAKVMTLQRTTEPMG